MLVEKALKSNGQLQYLGNIGLKVNLKLGGANSMIDMPFIKRSRVMMLGGESRTDTLKFSKTDGR